LALYSNFMTQRDHFVSPFLHSQDAIGVCLPFGDAS
jgi:hypothetical protein